ncbi:MAG: hypothetical protein ACYTGE_03535 [Planctomycetota bacterium]
MQAESDTQRISPRDAEPTLRTDSPLVEPAAPRKRAGLAAHAVALVVFAGGMFGVYRNLAGDLALPDPLPEPQTPAVIGPEEPQTGADLLCLNEPSRQVKVGISN